MSGGLGGLGLVAAVVLVGCAEVAARVPPSGTTGPNAIGGSEASQAPLIPPAAALVPPIEVHTLPSGLTVYLVPNHSAPLVCVQTWVAVGAEDENGVARGREADSERGLSGISHFFEHLMFQGTARYPNYDAALQPLGARNNAFTHADSTVFWVAAPREHLHAILDIEADRFVHLALDFVHVEPEREVVKSERRQNIDAHPAAVALERLARDTYDRGPYRWGPIGRMRDVAAVTIDEVRAYHAAHYRAGAMVLVIAGDFEPAAALADVSELYAEVGVAAAPALAGPLAPGPAALVEETWTGPRTDHVMRATAQTAAFWSFRVPAAGADPEGFAALELINWALTADKSGRLQKRLVMVADAPVASLWGALDATARLPAAWQLGVELLPGAEVAEVEAALTQELAAIARFGLSDDELREGAQSLRATLIEGTLSNADRGEAIGFGLRVAGTATHLFERIARLGQVTREAIRNAATTWLTAARRARVVVVAPTRLEALVRALTAAAEGADTAGSGGCTGCTALAAEAVANFLARGDAADARAEATDESEALALLRARAEAARAGATTAERTAIKAYLSTHAGGYDVRKAALNARLKTMADTEQQLERARVELTRRLAGLRRAGGTGGAKGHLVAAIGLLLQGPRTQSVVQDGPDGPPSGGSTAIALEVVWAWVLGARGLEASANERLIAAQQALDGLVERDPLAQLAGALASDLRVDNLPVVDRPEPRRGPAGPTR